MNVRVNLLKDSEKRYVGMVSRTFIIRVSAITGASLLILFLIAFLGHYRLVRQQLSSARDRWGSLKPAYDRARILRQDLSDRKKIISELGGWNASRIDWYERLIVLQQTVPPTIQLTKFLVRGELNMKEPPPVQKTAEPAAEPKKPQAEILPIPYRRFNINLYGKATGTLADQVVNHFVRTFRQADGFRQILENVKLRNLQREETSQSEQSERIFEVEAVSISREMK